MTSVAHAMVGASIAANVPDPLIAGGLILSSHFLMDMIPHWDFGTNWRKRSKFSTGAIAIADTLIAFTLAYLLFLGKVPFVPLTLAVVLSVLPDWLETPWYIFFARQDKQSPSKNASIFEHLAFNVYRIENMFHSKAQYPFGLLTQVFTVAFFVLLLGNL